MVRVSLVIPLCLSLKWSHSRTRKTVKPQSFRVVFRVFMYGSDEFSTLESYSRSTHMRSTNGTPLPSTSSECSPRPEGEPSSTETATSSTPFETARTPLACSYSIMSLESSLCPNISQHQFARVNQHNHL